MIEIDTPAIAVPHGLVLVVVLVEQSVEGDVVAVDDQTVLGGVAIPRGACAVVGAPDPDLVCHDVVTVDRDADVVLANDRAAGAHGEVVEERRIGCVINRAAFGADFKNRGRVDTTGFENQACNRHAVHVRHGNDRSPARLDQRREAEAEEDGVGFSDLQRVIQGVEARREENVLTGRQRGVDLGGAGGRGLRNEKLFEGNGFTRCRPCRPTDALGVPLQRRRKDAVAAGLVQAEIRLLADDRCLVDDGVRLFRKRACRRVFAAHKDHVPDRIAPSAPRAVARQPLLL